MCAQGMSATLTTACICVCVQGMSSPLAGQMVFRASLFGAFGQSKRWLGTNSDGSVRALKPLDFYKAGAITGRWVE